MFERVLKSRIFREYKIFFRNSNANFIYLMYLLIGGVVFESKVRIRTKCLYHLVCSICCIYLTITSVPCIYQEFIKSDKLDLVYILTAVQFALFPLCIVFTDFLGFVCRDNITRVVRQIDNEFTIDWKRIDRKLLKNYEIASISKSKKNSTIKSNLEKHLSILASTSGVLIIISVSVRYVWAYIIGFDKTLNNYYYYIGPVWGGEKIDSLTLYTLYTLGHAICMILVLAKATAVAMFFISVSGVYYDNFIKLAHIIDADSLFIRQSIEPIEIRRHELQRWKMARYENDQMSTEISLSFGKRCRDYLRAYRKIRNASEYLRQCVEIYFMSSSSFNMVYLTSTVYILTQETVPIVFKISVAILFIAAGILVLGPCFVGKQFHDANEIMMDAVYNTPWYYLPKIEGKMIHLFLCEVQNSPTKFTGFFVYPISTMTFPNVLSIYYKIANIMRTFYSRSKDK